MKTEDYFALVQKIVDACLWVVDASVIYEARPESQCFVRGDIWFLDNSRLHFREYVDCDPKVERLTYSYTYMQPDSSLIFRYDNTPHHFRLGLASFPDHKHVHVMEHNAEMVVESSRPELGAVLEEIGTIISQTWRDD